MATAELAYQSVGVERVIPVRVIHLHDTQNGGFIENIAYSDVQREIELANRTFRAAGVQFLITSVESFYTPKLSDLCGAAGPACPAASNNLWPWNDISAELTSVFPGATWPPPGNGWDANAQLTERQWLNYAKSRYGDRSKFHIFIAKREGNSGIFPWAGTASILMSPSTFDPVGDRGGFAHEIGHALGLAHTHDALTQCGIDVGDNADASLAWDLVYKPGSPPFSHTFFDSRAEAQAAGLANLRNIDRRCNCNPDADHKMSCDIGLGGGGTCPATNDYRETWGYPSAAMKALAFYFNVQHNPPTQYAYGANVMSYDTGPKTFISKSQTEVVRDFLRADVPVWDADGLAYLAQQPGGAGISTNHTRLGQGVVDWTSTRLTVDFNADGIRDVAVWKAPIEPGIDGTFYIYYGPNFSTQTAVSFGRLGDIPVLGNFRGGTATDVAVFQPGGGLNRDNPSDVRGFWRMCDATNCSVPVIQQWGDRTDIPLPGLDFDGNGQNELVVYRPSQGGWHIKQPESGVYYGSYYTSVADGVELLPGLYDNDEKTDIVVYRPGDATFHVKASGSSYSLKTWTMPSQLIPSTTAAGAGQSGAVAVHGMSRGIWDAGFLKRRSVLSLWDPATGNWYTIWDPFYTGSTFDTNNPSVFETCALGEAGDRPIGGLGSIWDTGNRTERAVYKPTTKTLQLQLSLVNNCSGALQTVQFSGLNDVELRQGFVTATQDATGDQLADVWVVDPQNGYLRMYASSSDFASTFEGSPVTVNLSLMSGAWGYQFR